jgi:predicted RNA-binding Zn ribbon-like protein
MSLTPAPGEDMSVALALVNTWHGGPTGYVDDLSTWSFAVRITAAEAAELADVRAAIRELFTALADRRMPAPASVALVNACAARLPTAPRLDWPPDGPRRHWYSDRPDTFDDAVATIARDAIDVVCGNRAPTVRRCAAHGCVRIFFREHARRQWCSNTCGDRVRAARHQRLRESARTDGGNPSEEPRREGSRRSTLRC